MNYLPNSLEDVLLTPYREKAGDFQARLQDLALNLFDIVHGIH